MGGCRRERERGGILNARAQLAWSRLWGQWGQVRTAERDVRGQQLGTASRLTAPGPGLGGPGPAVLWDYRTTGTPW